MSGYNLKNSDEVEEYLKNLYIEYKFGCLSEKNPEVCHLLGNYHEAVKRDYKEAQKVYKMNCDEYNFNRSCTQYGDYLAVGKDCEKNIPEAYKYVQKGCDLGDQKGCLHAGVLLLSEEKIETKRENQVARGLQILKKACDSNDEKSCFLLSGVYLNGIKGFVEKNLKEAYATSLKACEMGNPYACANVSIMHKKGDGVEQNLEMSKAFKGRAEKLLKELKEPKPQIKFQQGIDS